MRRGWIALCLAAALAGAGTAGVEAYLKLGVRVGDNARMAMVEYLGAPVESAADKKAAAAAKAGATGEAAKDEE